MKAILLIISLANQGYWFSGQEQSVSMTWSVAQKMPAADLQWELMLGEVRLAGDQIKMSRDDAPVVVKINIPAVRVRTPMRWVYRLTAHDGGKELESGQRTVNVFPPASLSGLAPRLAGKKLVVVDQAQGLPAVLEAAKIDVTRVAGLAGLEIIGADIIVIAADQIDDSAFAQAPLLAQARSGAQVLVLEQRRPKALCGYELRRRPVPAALEWRVDHPLFAGLDENDRKSWLSGESGDLRAIGLPADEPALELAYWPREVAGREPAPIDALVLTRTVDKGRIVLCQIPLGKWATDPRSHLFLENVLNYLLTRPEPTPRPSERPATMPTKPVPMPLVPSMNVP